MAEAAPTTNLELKNQDFEALRPHILELCKKALWPDHDPATVLMKELQGDDEYRAIGIIAKEDDKTRNDYVLHFPTKDQSILKDDVAILRFIKDNTSISISQVIAFDAGKDNALGCPHAFFRRIMGDNLLDAYYRLTPTQQRSVALQLGRAYREMINLRSSVPGELTSLTGEGIYTLPYLSPLDVTDLSPAPWDTWSPTASLRDWLTSRFTALKECLMKDAPEDSKEELMLLDCFIQMAAELEEGGFFQDVFYCMTHWHFAPVNMAVNASADGLTADVVIVNWEAASFAPVFTACNPPEWLWHWEDEDENEELKVAFEDAAGPEYRKWAYGTANELARALVDFAVDLQNVSESLEVGKVMVDEWAAFYEGKAHLEVLEQVQGLNIG